MVDATLELIGVRKLYGGVVAVDRVDLKLRKGEFLTFLGPSGSGKTTTLQMVAGLQSPSSGSILLDDAPLDPLPPYRRNIGMVFQHYALFPHMTLAKNIAFPLEMRRMGKHDVHRRVTAALEMVGLPDYGERYPRQLSGGQQQRVALARALVFEPPLLLMDEPLGALDKKLREEMQLEIMRLHRELRMSVLYVTHDQEEALVMSDRIAVFNAGRIEQIGAAKELYERPSTRFVAGFLGDSNFFPARVRQVEGELCVLDGAAGTMRALNTAALAVGSAAVVAVRPERLRLADGATAEEAGNIVEGKVKSVIYLGQLRKYIARLRDGQDVTFLQHARDAEQSDLAPGRDVRLTWRPREANALADAASAPT